MNCSPEYFNAYVDGFNLYKGILQDKNNLKWLDLRSFCQSRWPEKKLAEVYFFTAGLKERFRGDDAPRRQHTYIRALEGSGVHVIKGVFRKDPDWLRLYGTTHNQIIQPTLADPIGLIQEAFDAAADKAKPDNLTGHVWKFGEKGSDVNLASYLLVETLSDPSKGALVISGDSDLCTPIRFAVKAGAEVKVSVPNKGQGVSALRQAASYVEEMHADWLKNHQFPKQVLTTSGKHVIRPEKWS